MKRLTTLNDDPTYLDRYISIRNRKHFEVRTPLIAVHTFVEERYSALNEAVANDGLSQLLIDPRAIALRNVFRACYDGVTQPLRELKKAIKEAQPNRLLKYCPMCGTTLHSTFDHYLPAVRFPEFAVHPLNLVPCCARCNSTKDDDWLTETGERQYLHAYSDELPNRQFVDASLYEQEILAGVGAIFSLVRPADVSNRIWALVQSHFERLNLLDRYNELSSDEIAEIISDCRIFRDTGGPDARQFLAHRAAERRGVYGRNHWQAVLMQAIAEHENFEQWLE